MFYKIFNYFTLIFLFISSLQTFSASVCEVEAFSDSRFHQQGSHSSVIGVESYRQLLVRSAQSSLGVTSLTSGQIKALEIYHDVVRGEEGIDGTFVRVGNYTFSQRRRIVRFLREVFSPEQVTTLIEEGVVEISRSSDLRITRRVLRRVNKGNKVFIQLRDDVFKVSEILQETKSGFLIEVETVNKQGQIVKDQVFLIRDNVDTLIRDLDLDMIRISEKTDRGFVIDALSRMRDHRFGYVIAADNRVFFSFEKAIENGLLPENPTAKDYHKIEDMINEYISLKQAQSHDKNAPYLSDRTYFDFVDSLHKSIIRGAHDFRLVSPESEAIFLATESTRKKVNSNELDFPYHEEAQLAERGYKENYTGRLNQMSKWPVIQRRLQELRVNPRTTHIEYFANQVSVHIAHIRQGLEENYFPNESLSQSDTKRYGIVYLRDTIKSTGSKLNQLERLNGLEKEAKQAIRDEKVTYKWWLEFNLKLARLMYGLDTNLQAGDRSFVSLSLESFPLKTIIPTIQMEEKGIGIITFNRTGLAGVYPAGLINHRTAKVDGDVLPAPDFFNHDILHVRFEGNRLYHEYSFGHLLFHRRLLNNIENLPPNKRMKAENIYFLMTHEYRGINIGYSDWSPQQMRRHIIIEIPKDVADLFKLPDDPAQRQKEIEDLADTFMEVYVQALQHQ